MTHGFDMQDDLVCEGIIGDGCGGGRIFTIKDDTLVAFDPQTQSYIELLKDISNAVKISKSGCLISIVCENETICFDLSALQRI